MFWGSAAPTTCLRFGFNEQNPTLIYYFLDSLKLNAMKHSCVSTTLDILPMKNEPPAPVLPMEALCRDVKHLRERGRCGNLSP